MNIRSQRGHMDLQFIGWISAGIGTCLLAIGAALVWWGIRWILK